MRHNGPVRTQDWGTNAAPGDGLGADATPNNDGEFHALRQSEKQFFVFTKAGKPVLSSHWDDEAMSPTIFATLQALVACIRNSLNGESVQQLVAGRHRFVFGFHGALCFVVIACTGEPLAALARQLERVHRYILFHLTAGVDHLLASRPQYDARCLLADTGATTHRLVAELRSNPGFFLHAVRCLPLDPILRHRVGDTIGDVLCERQCPDLLAAVLCTTGLIVQLITRRNAPLDAIDMLLLLSHAQYNDLDFTEDTITPVCLPEFNPGMVYAYTRRLCHFCVGPPPRLPLQLILLTHVPQTLDSLHDTAEEVCARLQSNGAVEEICRSVTQPACTVKDLLEKQPEKQHALLLRHVLYRCCASVQYFATVMEGPADEDAQLMQRYSSLRYQSQLWCGLYVTDDLPGPGVVGLLVTPHFEVYGRFTRRQLDMEGLLRAAAGKVQARADELFLCDLRSLD